MVSDGKVLEYRNSLTMVICMTLRFLHAALIRNTVRFAKFKLRGTTCQFTTAVALYSLIFEHKGKVPENELLWAIHHFLDSVLRPPDLGHRPIDSPVDQMIFLWACLSDGRYRISKHISSLGAAIKCGLRCVAIHSARIHAQKIDSSSLFYAHLLDDQEADEEEASHSDTNDSPPYPDSTADPEPTPEQILERIRIFNSKGN